MKKVFIYVMAILLVPWTSCQNNKAENPTGENKNAMSVPAPVADMILPQAKDTTLPSGRHNIYLVSSRDQKGLFVERSDFPAGYIGMPHVHSDDLYVTILKGSVYLGFGEKIDTTLTLKPLGVGSFLKIPADQAHFEWFKEACTMQIEGTGPQSTYFITPETKDKKN